MCRKLCRISRYWNDNKYKPSWNNGFILDGLRCLFSIFRMASPIRCKTWQLEKKGVSKRIRYKYVDWYIIIWLIIEFGFLLSVIINPRLIYCNAFRIILFIFIGYRLFDIFQSWVGQFVLGGTPYKWSPINIYRSLVLVFIGYLEIVISYTLLAFALNNNFQGISCLQQAFYYSIGNMITIGSGIAPVHCLGYVLFSTQIIFVILFLTSVVSRIISRE